MNVTAVLNQNKKSSVLLSRVLKVTGNQYSSSLKS